MKLLMRLILAFSIIFIIGYSAYLRSDFHGSRVLNKEINNIIASNKKIKLKKLCLDDKTYEYISKFPMSARCSKTSTSQGRNSKGEYYFVTLIYNEKVEVYMKRDTYSEIIYRLFPSWEVKGLEIKLT